MAVVTILLKVALCVVICLNSSSRDYLVSAQAVDGIFENVVEGFVKDLLTRELTSANNQNMTDCMTRLLCESICSRTAKGEIKGQPMLNSAQFLGSTEGDPLGYFFTGGDRGYRFGKSNQCHLCKQTYSNCLQSRYDDAKTSAGAYEQTMLDGAESSIGHDFMEL